MMEAICLVSHGKSAFLCVRGLLVAQHVSMPNRSLTGHSLLPDACQVTNSTRRRSRLCHEQVPRGNWL